MSNVASGDEWVPFQVGRYAGPEERAEVRAGAEEAAGDAGVVENIRSGDAQVGVQVDEWEGDLDLEM